MVKHRAGWWAALAVALLPACTAVPSAPAGPTLQKPQLGLASVGAMGGCLEPGDGPYCPNVPRWWQTPTSPYGWGWPAWGGYDYLGGMAAAYGYNPYSIWQPFGGWYARWPGHLGPWNDLSHIL